VNTDLFLFALCVWREARSLGMDGMTAVAWVIRNRLRKGEWGNTLTDVVTAHLQFSAMTALGDPETVLWPNSLTPPADAEAWREAVAIVQEPENAVDPTHGATHYFSRIITTPSWAESMVPTLTVGNTVFYR
jgi:spore germination cell wall hydrolase CwlJ-like protein